MIKVCGTICSKKSTTESEVHVGSGFCARCDCFNGKFTKEGKKCVSCLWPE